MSQKVLVIESDAPFAEELRTSLTGLGFVVTVVDDGNSGLALAASERPSLILLAVELPKTNGFSICNRLKKDSTLKDIPLIILSSESSSETFEQHKKLKMRAEEYVHKPVSFADLQPILAQYLPMEGDGIAVVDELVVDRPHAESSLGDRAHAESSLGDRKTDAPPSMSAVPLDEAGVDDAFDRVRQLTPPPPTVGEDRTSGASVAQLAAFDEARANAEAMRVELEIMQQALSEARAQAGREERLRAEATAEAERIGKELEAIRVRPASIPPKGKDGDREVLARKEKEILNYREALAKKDRELFDHQDKLLGEARRRADLEEKLLGRDRELEEAREAREALDASLDARLTELTDVQGQLADLRKSSELELKNLREKSEREAAEAKSAHEAATKAAEEAAAAALKAAEEAAAAAKEAELTKEHVVNLAALHRAHQEEMGKAKATIATLEEKSESLGKSLATAEIAVAELAELKTVKAALDTAFDEQKADLAKTKDLLVTTEAQAASLSAEKMLLEEKVTKLTQELATTTTSRDNEQARAEKALTKWSADKGALEKAKDSLAEILQRLEEIEGRTLS